MAKSRAKKPPPTKPPTPAVARQVFSELNATFYTADPGEFLTMRVEALSLMAAPDEALAASFGSERTIGATQFGSMPVPDAEARQRYIQTEAVIIFHHAAELVLRLFFAHTERETCPWFAMAASTSFADFKDKVAKSLDAGFDRVEIAMVFLGGTDPKDAAIGATEEEFSETVEAIRQLLHFAAYRLLKESFLYNASKHGLTAVQLDNKTEINLSRSFGRSIEITAGRMLTYLHKQKSPGSKEGPQWYVSMTGSLPDQDLGVTLMIQRAVSSLWSVSRRRYTAEPGEVYIMTPLGVQDAIYAPIAASLNVVRTLGLELPKQDLDGEIIRGQEHELYGEHVPKGWIEAKKGDFRESEIKLIHLPVRQKDKRPINPSRRSLLPFSPDGSSRV